MNLKKDPSSGELRGEVFSLTDIEFEELLTRIENQFELQSNSLFPTLTNKQKADKILNYTILCLLDQVVNLAKQENDPKNIYLFRKLMEIEMSEAQETAISKTLGKINRLEETLKALLDLYSKFELTEQEYLKIFSEQLLQEIT